MPNLRSKTWTTTTPANVEDAQFWEDHLISDADAAKIGSSVQSVNGVLPNASGNVALNAVYEQTLTAGSTSVTFTNVTTTSDSLVYVGTSVAGLDYDDITQSGTSYTVTFDAQASDVTIYLIVTEVA